MINNYIRNLFSELNQNRNTKDIKESIYENRKQQRLMTTDCNKNKEE